MSGLGCPAQTLWDHPPLQTVEESLHTYGEEGRGNRTLQNDPWVVEGYAAQERLSQSSHADEGGEGSRC
jgi:hypothetical protein